MLWALRDASGLPAKRFAEHNPVPVLEWLEHLGEWMTLGDEGTIDSSWDAVIRYLVRWLLRHLDDPVLLLQLVKHGGRLHRKFVECAEQHLAKLDKHERDGNTEELCRIRDNAPRAVPRPEMRTLWRLMFAGRMESSSLGSGIGQWYDRFERDGLTLALRLELRTLLTPRISPSKPYYYTEDQEDSGDPEQIKKDITLSAGRYTCHIVQSPRESALAQGTTNFAGRFRHVVAGHYGPEAGTRPG